MQSAVFTISLDCELLWGSHYVGGEKRYPYLKHGFSEYYRGLLDLCERYKISATFAFVGAIAMSAEEFNRKVAHIPVDSPYGNWLESISAAQIAAETESSWYARGIIDSILASKQKHEIASHSFTHLRFNRIDAPEVAAFELAASAVTLSKYCGARLKTFIFPENRLGHLKEFKSSPYFIYRGEDDTWYKNLPLQSFFHFIDQVLPIPPRPVTLATDEYGNTYVPGSILLFAYDGVRYLKVKNGIDRAIAEKKIFHLWFHPWNLGSSPRMLKLLERVFVYVDKCRAEGSLSVATIGDLASISESTTE